MSCVALTDWLYRFSSQYHSPWCPGDARRRGINRHGIDFVCLEEQRKKWHVESKVILTGNDVVIQWTAWEASLLFLHVISHAYTIFYHLKITWREWLAPVYLKNSTIQLLKTWRLEEPGNRQQWYIPGYLGIFRVKQCSLLWHELPWHNPKWIIICRRYQSVELLRAQLLFCLWLYWWHLIMNL